MIIKNLFGVIFLIVGIISILFGDWKAPAPFSLEFMRKGKSGKERMNKTSLKFWKWPFGIILIIIGIIIIVYPI